MKPHENVDKSQVEQRRKTNKEKKRGRNDIGAAMEKRKTKDYKRRKQHDHEESVEDYDY